MKSLKMLLASLAIVALGASGCKKDATFSGIDHNMPKPVGLEYDELLSSDKAIVVNWGSGETINAGAKSYTVQICAGEDEGVYSYDKDLSKDIKAEEKLTCSFDKFSKGNLYYIRVRANYPGSVLSDWVYITLGQEGMKYAVEPGVGLVNTKLAGISKITYSETLSGATYLGFDVEADASSGAEEFLFLLDSKKASTPDVSNIQAPDEKSTVFSELKAKERYTLRGRARYTVEGKTVYSIWCNASAVVGEQTLRIFEVGKGPVEEVPPTARIKSVTSSTAAVEWSSNEFNDIAGDVDTPWVIGIYNDESCSSKIVSWTLSANPSDGVSASKKLYEGQQPHFLFSGLKPGTKYYFQVKDGNSDLSSKALEVETLPFQIVEVSDKKAAPSEIIVAEDFGELVWGGDLIGNNPGYSSTKRASLSTMEHAEGDHPVTGGHFYLTAKDTEMGLFNTLAMAVPSTRLKTWGAINEGPATSYTCARPGYLKLGASKYMVHIATPVLSSLNGIAKVQLSFKAARYESDTKTAAVYLVSSSNMGEQNALKDVSAAPVIKFDLPEDKQSWAEYSFEVEGVTPTSRIAIGCTREDGSAAGAKQHRMYVDDIVIKLLEYTGEIEPTPAPTNLKVTPKPTSLSVSWDAVDGADKYILEYKAADASSWTSVSLTVNSHTIEGLAAATIYDIRVLAEKKGIKSEYVSAKTSTTAASSLIEEISTGSELVEWLSNANSEATGEYKIIADIDMHGLSAVPAAGFGGTLDGQGHVIKNWKSTTPLFTSNNGTIKNIVIESSCKFFPATAEFGTIVGDNKGTVSSCENKAAITIADESMSTGLKLGGIAGKSSGLVEKCKNSGKISLTGTSSAIHSIGGVVGYFEGKEGKVAVDNCENKADVIFSITGTPKNMYIGGVVGSSVVNKSANMGNYGVVKDCSSSGNVTHRWTVSGGGSYCNVGGVVGYIEGDVENLTNTGVVTLDSPSDPAAVSTRPTLGGVAGYVYYNAKNCVNKGKVFVRGAYSAGTKGNAGAGCMYQPTFGGVIGGIGSAEDKFSKSGSLVDCHNEGELDIEFCQKSGGGTQSNVGAVAGYSSVPTENCYNTGKAKFNSSANANRLGGVIGYAVTKTLKNCYNDADLTCDARNDALETNATNKLGMQYYLGGIAGYVFKGASVEGCENRENAVITFTGCNNTKSLSYVGGISGSYSDSFNMSGCQNKGKIVVDSKCSVCIGGIAGGFNGTMTGNVNSGKINVSKVLSPAGKESEVGGLIGYANASLSGNTFSGTISSTSSTVYIGGLAGGFNGDKQTWSGDTVSGTITSTGIKGSILGRYRSGGKNLTLGADGAPETIKGELKTLDLCGDLKGSTITEANVVKE